MEAVELRVSKKPEPYPEAVAFMERRVAEIRQSRAPETLWLLEHPPLYTAGSSAKPDELVDPDRFPVFRTGRGGRYTYHGPGQRVAYVMIDLAKRRNDVRAYVRDLEEWIMACLARFGINGERIKDRIGIWAGPKGREKKIAALGVRIRRWVTFHGIAVNVNVDLEHFSGIVPCGISGAGVTSLKDQGVEVAMSEVDSILMETFEEVFGRTLGPAIGESFR